MEDSLTLDLSKLVRDQLVRPGHNMSNRSLIWTNISTGERTASVGYDAHLGEDHGRMRLVYTTTIRLSDEKHHLDYWIELVTTPQPFGGRRWWFVCPRTGARVTKLHLPNGAYTFASRKAFRLGYRSQREIPRDRALSRAFKLRGRLGAEGGIGNPVFKPKGMRWATYDREMARIDAAEDIVEAYSWALIQRLDRKLGR